MLVGIGGSGKRSLSSLATFIAFSSEPAYVENNWQEDIQNAIKFAGLELRPVALVLTDSNLTENYQNEDICNLLN